MKPLIIANWKANPDSSLRAVSLARKIEGSLSGIKKTEVVLAPPYPFLESVRAVVKRAKLGSQNIFWGDIGPFTGEVSWRQLKSLGVKYVIIGHSERRIYFNETDEAINKKALSTLEHGLTPVLCVGEHDRSGNEIPPVVGEQLVRAIKGIKKDRIRDLVVAYEPVWAISTMSGSRPDTPDNAFRASVFIRKTVSDLYGRKAADLVRVIYGGSVNVKNISSFLKEGKMEGALVGAASLRPEEFASIIKIADSVSP